MAVGMVFLGVLVTLQSPKYHVYGHEQLHPKEFRRCKGYVNPS